MKQIQDKQSLEPQESDSISQLKTIFKNFEIYQKFHAKNKKSTQEQQLTKDSLTKDSIQPINPRF